MDFNILKADFIKYLERNLPAEDKQANAMPQEEGSIFDSENNDFINLSTVSLLAEYKDEFSEYLKQEYDFDWSDSMGSLEELMDYELFNGEIVNPDDLSVKERRELRQAKRAQASEEAQAPDATGQENEEAPLIEEVPDTNAPLNPDGTQPTTLNVTSDGLSNWGKENGVKMVDAEFMADAFNDLLKNEDFKNIIKDENGNITEESFSKFLKVVSNYDQKNKNLSLQDLMLATEDIEEGTFRYLTDEEITDTVTEEGKIDTPLSNQNGLSAPGSRVSAGSMGSPQALPTRDSNGNLLTDNMTVEQLEAQKVETTQEHDANTEALDTAIKDEAGQELKTSMEEALTSYEEAVREVDTELADKLAAQQEKIGEIDNQITENENAITENDNVISTQTQNINAADAKISSLNSALSAVKSAASSAEDEQKSDYQAQAAEIEQQIAQAESEKQEAQAALDEANAKKEELSAKQEELQASLAEAMEEMQAIEEEIQTLETDNPQIAAEREKYDQAKEAYFEHTSQTKPENIQKAREACNNTQQELTQIDKALSEAKAKEEALKYNPNGSVLEYAYEFLGMSESQVESAIGGKNLPDGLWCSAFVRQMMLGTHGQENLPDWYNNCNSNSCSEVYSAANQNGCAFTDASQAQPGDVIFFNTGRGNCRHTGIVVSVDPDGTIHTIEGNTSSKVGERTYDPDGGKIFGFARIG